MIETVAGSLAALRGTIDLISGAVEARDSMKVRGAMVGINDQIIAVQDACMRLQDTNATLLQDKHALANEKRELEDEVMQLKQQMDKLAQYERFRTPVGAVVYIDKATRDSTDGAVYACPSCMDEGKTSTLQAQHAGKILSCFTHGMFGFHLEPYKGPFSGRAT